MVHVKPLDDVGLKPLLHIDNDWAILISEKTFLKYRSKFNGAKYIAISFTLIYKDRQFSSFMVQGVLKTIGLVLIKFTWRNEQVRIDFTTS